jgi:nitrate reductase NapAB chaperone NapD
MLNDTDKELTHGQMEKNTLEDGKMIIVMDKELEHTLMEKLLKVYGKTTN